MNINSDDTYENKEYDKLLTHRISRISFIFVSLVIIAGGYTTQLLSCSTQKILETNIYAKHLIGIFLIFMFIMLEGGWEFNADLSNPTVNNWSNGNCLSSMVYAICIYLIFLMSSKMRFNYTITFFVLLFILYITNTQRLYYRNRNKLDNEYNHKIINIETIIFWLLPFVLIMGVIDYYFYKKKEMGKKFNLLTFMIGCTKCKKL